ncbi:MAG: lipoate--protein ligase family protein [Acidimicrobiia bacterium]|nr:lipoate--protein ligase family protein [Acidimicrobiia bacterium]
MALPPITLHTEGFPGEPGLDIAVSAVLHEWVARGEVGPTARVHRTSRMVAFGRRDTHEERYVEAAALSRAQGYAPVERLAGGRAAVFHEGTIGVSLVTPEADSTVGIHDRFETIAALTVDALADLGLDPVVGEVPGEYCPGEYSVSEAGRVKLAGYGQRLIKGAAHVGGVVVVSGAEEVNRLLVPIYEVLDLPLDPAATGAIAHESGPATVETVIGAFSRALAQRWDVGAVPLPASLVEEARDRVPGLLSPYT